MSATDQQKLSIDEIFYEALRLPSPTERSAYLDSACADDPARRQRVENLLAAYPQAQSFLESAAAASCGAGTSPALTLDQPTSQVGTMTGPYKLLEQIGEGGMGVVYMAQQTEPVKRRVALKVIKPGMDSRQVVARFEAERQALAMMDHPNIARVLDAGTTDSGRPYFVMELVRGVAITDYCDREKLNTRRRLELFADICRAVQHAHQKAVIHRDLKPSNVLVTLHDGVPVVKVIDFGVAKALNQELTERTLFTQFSQMIGTPLYMSPEQAELSGLDIDTRSDVYSLGVLLYELLTGTTPFDKEALSAAGFDEMRRIIREEEPPRPSTRISTLQAAGKTTLSHARDGDPRQLSQRLRGELDWIVMKALEKDRTRRYESANSFAADIQRYLDDEPVAACPPSASYRFRKFARKNRATLTTAALVAAALLLGTIVSSWQAVRTTQGYNQAKANEVRALGEEKKALEAASAERQAKQAEAAERARAEANAAKARDEEQKAKGAAQEERKAKEASIELQKRAEAAEADTKAFSDFLVLHVLAAPRPEGVQYGKGISITVAAALEAAEPNVEKVFAGRPRAEAIARDALGKTWRILDDYVRAEADLRRAYEIRKQELGPGHPDTLDTANSLGSCLSALGRKTEAIAVHEKNVEQAKISLGPDDSPTISYAKNLLTVYVQVGRIGDALKLAEESYKAILKSGGPDHRVTIMSGEKLAWVYAAAGKENEALTLLEGLLERSKAKLGAQSDESVSITRALAPLHWQAGQMDRGIALAERALELTKKRYGPEHVYTGRAMHDLALGYQAAGRLDEAGQNLETAIRILRARLGPDHPEMLTPLSHRGSLHLEAGELQEAESVLRETLAKANERLGRDHPIALSTARDLARVYDEMGQYEPALSLLEEGINFSTAKLGRNHPGTLRTMAYFGINLLHQRKYVEAEPLLRECLAANEKARPDRWETFSAKSLLGACLLGQARAIKDTDSAAAEQKLTAAEPLLVAGYEGLKAREATIQFSNKIRLTEALQRLVLLYTELDKPDQAAEWRKELDAKAAEQLK